MDKTQADLRKFAKGISKLEKKYGIVIITNGELDIAKKDKQNEKYDLRYLLLHSK